MQTAVPDTASSVLEVAHSAKPEPSTIVSNVSKTMPLVSTTIKKFIWILVLLFASMESTQFLLILAANPAMLLACYALALRLTASNAKTFPE